MGSLHVDHVTVEFPVGPNTPPVKALSDVDLEIKQGEFVVALGATDAPWRVHQPGHYGRERCAMSRAKA